MEPILEYNSIDIGPEYIRLYDEHKNDSKPKTTVQNITGSLKYVRKSKIIRPTAYLDQRKLFLSGLNYLSIIGDVTYLVYAGAAPGNHLYELTRYFPNLSIIAIDPGKFDIFVRDEQGKMVPHTLYDTGDILELHKNVPREEYFGIIHQKQYKIYIIQDLFTDDLAELLKPLNPAFISDIRTSVMNTDGPSDTDIVWNLAQQFNWINLIQPSSAYVKFCYPFHSDELKLDANEGINESFEKSKQFGIDFVSDYKANNLIYFNGFFLLQPFSPQSSTETGLFVPGEVITNKNFINYGNIQWYEDKFFYYNNIERGFIIHDNDYVDRELGFDHCGDCSLETYIWKLYQQQKNPQFNPVNGIRDTLMSLSQTHNLFKDGHGNLFPGNEEHLNDLLMTKTVTTIESFPFKREFIDPEELWTNAVTLDLAPIKVVQPEERWWSLPRNIRWQFMDKTLAFVVDDTAYDKINKLVDYFSEEARIHARRKSCLSQFDYFNKNYDTVVAKAQELMKENPSLPFRHHLREALYFLNKECSAFKISLAKAVLKYFGSKIVLDPSAGWGDRLFGAAAAGVSVYHGVDPNRTMKHPFDEMLAFIRSHDNIGENYSIIFDDFLEVDIQREAYDTIFTSPPFFDYEIYSKDPEQSIVGRTDVGTWLVDFLYPYLRKAWGALAKNGYMILYISDVGSNHYVQSMFRFVNTQLHGEFLGVIAATNPYLDHAWPLWVWRKH